MSVPPEKPNAPAKEPVKKEPVTEEVGTDEPDTPVVKIINETMLEAVEDMRLAIGMDAKVFKDGFGKMTPEQQYTALKAVKIGMKPRLTKNEPIIPTPTGGGESPFSGKIGDGNKVSWNLPLTTIARNKVK